MTLTAKPEDVGLSSERLARIDGWMRGLVADGRLPFVQTMIMRRGEVVWHRQTGLADIARDKAIAPDTIVRIYSMTKPLTSVAIMMLYEEGRFQLDDPITRFLPCFRNMCVVTDAGADTLDTVPAEREITFRDLLTHTSGLTYDFMRATALDAHYREKGVDFQGSARSLGEVVETAATLPLLAQPGTQWNYSIATDVLGHLVAVISGQPFGDFLRERVIVPLGMVDTDFVIAPDKVPRFASNYTKGPDGRPKLLDDGQASTYAAPRLASGGGGLVSTAADYMRFCRFMLNKGTLDGVRLLGRKTVELMTTNHLPGDMAQMGQPRFSESPYDGIGFGLGFSVMLEPAKAQILGTPGEYAWGGAASTAFWIDPAEDMAVVQLTQLMPSSTYPIRRELRVLAYQAIVD
ncbi:serine hydrolase domain-containing protein [Enterovirga rhinocerotis]|uniref:CubicO group peptidase (Beta-lactamase class C family) n=1 Tax=Enterovirga rhinocerotis TaxID=1339210 RepID=A0A4V6PZI3_9HYPH|nr:serine hydrolase domain-containing protein [Enterovirga rhinocerotis]TDR89159.1 CubicO group peptidase (beta-lactamase class C family) [Enterovirga rhinocerotis]